jgi:hypothetical protein
MPNNKNARCSIPIRSWAAARSDHEPSKENAAHWEAEAVPDPQMPRFSNTMSDPRLDRRIQSLPEHDFARETFRHFPNPPILSHAMNRMMTRFNWPVRYVQVGQGLHKFRSPPNLPSDFTRKRNFNWDDDIVNWESINWRNISIPSHLIRLSQKSAEMTEYISDCITIMPEGMFLPVRISDNFPFIPWTLLHSRIDHNPKQTNGHGGTQRWSHAAWLRNSFLSSDPYKHSISKHCDCYLAFPGFTKIDGRISHSPWSRLSQQGSFVCCFLRFPRGVPMLALHLHERAGKVGRRPGTILASCSDHRKYIIQCHCTSRLMRPDGKNFTSQIPRPGGCHGEWASMCRGIADYIIKWFGPVWIAVLVSRRTSNLRCESAILENLPICVTKSPKHFCAQVVPVQHSVIE